MDGVGKEKNACSRNFFEKNACSIFFCYNFVSFLKHKNCFIIKI
jgi:hypothetical protein